MDFNHEHDFKINQEKEFLKDLVPNQLLTADAKKDLEEQIHEVHLALLQKNESALTKIKKFLDKTIIEF